MPNQEQAEYAFQWALENIVDARNDQVLILHVRSRLPGLAGLALSRRGSEGPAATAAADASHKLLARLAAALEPAERVNVVAESLAASDPRDAIIHRLQRASETVSTVLVVGSRGLGSVARSLMGSTSDYLVRNSSVPVIVVRQQE
ncbi:hypothetical protein HK405_012841 [Cladochytrium tenue]|nr:hypothetical protein HK405_012841 [Cladochytrium tenue]